MNNTKRTIISLLLIVFIVGGLYIAYLQGWMENLDDTESSTPPTASGNIAPPLKDAAWLLLASPNISYTGKRISFRAKAPTGWYVKQAELSFVATDRSEVAKVDSTPSEGGYLMVATEDREVTAANFEEIINAQVGLVRAGLATGESASFVEPKKISGKNFQGQMWEYKYGPKVKTGPHHFFEAHVLAQGRDVNVGLTISGSAASDEASLTAYRKIFSDFIASLEF